MLKVAGTFDVETPSDSLLQQIRHYNAKLYDDCCPKSSTL